MQAFNMTTIGYDPFVSAEEGKKFNIEVMSLDEIWPLADYITVHTPLLPHTRNLIGGPELGTKCKQGVKIINAARGGIIDEVELLKALENGRCGGAGLDVFAEEPPTDFRLCQHPKVSDCDMQIRRTNVSKWPSLERAQYYIKYFCNAYAIL